MGERWVILVLDQDETLKCEFCLKYLHEEKVHLYMDVNDQLVETMCDACWKKEGEKSNG